MPPNYVLIYSLEQLLPTPVLIYATLNHATTHLTQNHQPLLDNTFEVILVQPPAHEPNTLKRVHVPHDPPTPS